MCNDDKHEAGKHKSNRPRNGWHRVAKRRVANAEPEMNNATVLQKEFCYWKDSVKIGDLNIARVDPKPDTRANPP